MRLHVFAEGETERYFFMEAIAPRLAEFGVYGEKPVLVAHALRGGTPHRGGGGRYKPMRDDIRRRLMQDANPRVRFTTMIDLYAIASDFPGLREHRDAPPHERIERMEREFADDVGDPRFIPHIELHEFEIAILSDPACLAGLGPARSLEARIQRLRRAVESTASASPNGKPTPELVDDGPDTAPSKRIAAEFPAYAAAKGAFAAELAASVGLPVIRSQCPHFDAWISTLERLGASSA